MDSTSEKKSLQQIRKAFTDLHGMRRGIGNDVSDHLLSFLRKLTYCAGEMVLLLHWSLLNYTAVVKILKKHGEPVWKCQFGQMVLKNHLYIPSFALQIRGRVCC